MKVWITKYALTRGNYEMEVVSMGKDSVYGKAWNEAFHGEGREWHRTYGSAAAMAEKMRKRKIENLRNQISRLEKIDFGFQKIRSYVKREGDIHDGRQF